MTTEPTFYVQLNRPDRWCIVRAYHDQSGVIAIYGLFADEDTADLAKMALQNDGILDALAVMPFTYIYAVTLDPANPPDGTS